MLLLTRRCVVGVATCGTQKWWEKIPLNRHAQNDQKIVRSSDVAAVEALRSTGRHVLNSEVVEKSCTKCAIKNILFG